MKQFSIAASGAPGRQEEFTTGSPFIDAKGQVVAIFSQSIPLPAQTYRLAAPTIDLSDRIEKVVRAGLKLEIPIPEEQQPFDPAVFSEEYSALSEAVIKGELARARRHSATLMEKYPDSVFAKFSHLSALSALFFSGAMEPTVLTEFVEQLKVPENAAPWARGIYHFQLGETLNKEEKTEDAITHYQKSDELYPDGMACATLAIFFERKRQKEKAEHYARRAVAFEPDRISYWDTLQRILFAQGKFKEARVAKARISLLEKLYSIR